MVLKRAGLLDLPAAALTAIASCLGISDKKSLALSCSAMPAIIRPLWTALQVDLASEETPPAALANFSGITTIVVVDSSEPLPVLATSTQPAFHNEIEEDYEWPKSMPVYSMTTLSHLSNVINTVLAAAASSEQEDCRELSLRIGVPGKKDGGVLQLFIEKISPKLLHGSTNVALAALSMLQTASGLLAGGNGAAAGSAAHTSYSPATAQGTALRSVIDKLILHPAFLNMPSSNNATAGMPQNLLSKATSALDHIHHLSSGGSPYYPFTSVDAGWFTPDGCLVDLITKGAVVWREDTRDDQYRLELYTRLHTLHFSVLDDFLSESTTVGEAFAARAIPKINALPMLRELHLSLEAPQPQQMLSIPVLMLPELTRLVLGECFTVDSFKRFTQLSKLQQLNVNFMRGFDDADYNEYKLSHLAPLSSLHTLEVSEINMHCCKGIQHLTALTSLKLRKLWRHSDDDDDDNDAFYSCGDSDDEEDKEKGGRIPYILPDAPMPRLRELDLVFSMSLFLHDQTLRYKSDETIDWVLQNGATTFPGIETMRLGVLMIQTPPKTKIFTMRLAARLMNTRVRGLLSKAPNLKYLIIDQARVEKESLLYAAIKSGEFGEVSRERLAIKTGKFDSVDWHMKMRVYTNETRKRDVRARFIYTRM